MVSRREFLSQTAATAVVTTASTLGATNATADSKTATVSSRRELTVAGFQMLESKNVDTNERAIHRAIDKAAGVKADFLLTPEGSLSGYYPDFDRVVVADAVQRVARHAKEMQVGLLLGTCYNEMEEGLPGALLKNMKKTIPDSSPLAGEIARDAGPREFCYDRVRVYAPNGEYLGAHSKILLCSSIYHPGTGEIRDYTTKPLRTFSWDGICFGVLICNDLFASPGFTPVPDPYLAWRLWEMGAQVIFHAVGTAGTPLFYRTLQEATQAEWAMALGTPIVTTNSSDGTTPSNCLAGVIGPDGERKLQAHEVGEQFFSYKLSIA